MSKHSSDDPPWQERSSAQTASLPDGSTGRTLKTTRRRAARPSAALLVAAAVAVAVALLSFASVFESLELRTHDARFHKRGPIATNARIVIAGLDEKSEQAWSGEPIVFWTGHYAEMIRNAQAAGARVVGLDVIPAVSSERYLEAQYNVALKDGGQDTRFAKAIQEANDRAPGFVVFAEQIFGIGVDESHFRSHPNAPAQMFIEMPEVVENLGIVDFPASPDGVIRKSFRSARAGDGGVPIPSFAAIIADHARRTAMGRPGSGPPEVASQSDGDPLPSFYVDPTLTDFPHVSAVDLARGTLSDTERRNLRDSVVLIGSTATDGGDFHVGPDRRYNTGVALQAQAIATLLDGRDLRRLSNIVEAFIALIFGLAATALTAACVWGGGGKFVGYGVDAFTLFLAVLAWIVTAFLLFVHAHLLLPVIAPVLALTLPCLAFRAVYVATEWLIRTRIETEFGHYASPEIRDYLLGHPDLEPETRDVSVLFLDIRGSTAYAELRVPAEVMGELNAMFRAIDGVLQRHHGLLYRYTGDGFLAVFGAPKPSTTHAADAVRCAIELLRESHRFNQSKVAEGHEAWSIGCSVNSGTAAAGKFGTAERLEYTVVGDVVNLAAKIEAKNKDANGVVFSDLVVTEATLMRAPGVDHSNDLQPVRLAVDVVIGGRQNTARLSFYKLAEANIENETGVSERPAGAVAPSAVRI